MLIFPQLATGASVQYPIRKRRSERTILNVSEDGHVLALPDDFAALVRWELALEGLTYEETTGLTSFYTQCEGPLQPFLFFDPTENLLAYSEDFTQPAWQVNSLITVGPGVDDPFGANRATRLVNTSEATLSMTQTIQVPGFVQCAYSVYLRCDQSLNQTAGIELSRKAGPTISIQAVNPGGSWGRVSQASVLSGATTSCDFSLSIPRGVTLDVFGAQVDAQPLPGKYVMSTDETGVYPNCRFDSNQMAVIGTGPGQSSVRIFIVSKASQ